MQRSQLPQISRHTFVVPRHKIVYVSTPKVACTSLKQVIAELAGETVVAEGVIDASGESRNIHQRGAWQRTRTLHQMSDAELAEISGDNGWMIFAAVRHPASRLWSAWQEKVLLAVPRVVRQVPGHLLAAPPTGSPADTDAIAESFRRFVRGLADGEAAELMDNVHFRPQRQLLRPGRVPYTRIYTLDELSTLMSDLDRQTRASGGGPVPALPARNSTPLKPLRSMFTRDVRAAIRSLYAGDFRAWFRGAGALPHDVQDRKYTDGELAAISQRLAAADTSSAGR